MLIAEYDYATDIAVQRAEERKIAYTEGKSLGLAEGKSLGLAEGSRQKALETAKTMLTMGYPLWIFVKFPGLLQTKCSRLVICNAIMGNL